MSIHTPLRRFLQDGVGGVYVLSPGLWSKWSTRRMGAAN
jgi:hypothetical protein